MSKKILYQPWGGLGDNLQYSTLPELYNTLGHEFYISSKNVYRNPEIYKLVWELNPYVKGISDEEYNVGSCMNYTKVKFVTDLTQLIGFQKYITHQKN